MSKLSSSAAIPGLRAADLPERPRRIERTLLVDVVAGEPITFMLLLLVIVPLCVSLAYATGTDARRHGRDVVAVGTVTSVFEEPSGDGMVWGVVVSADDGKLPPTTSYFDGDVAPLRVASRVPLVAASDDGELVVDGGRARKHDPGFLLIGLIFLVVTAASFVVSAAGNLRHVRLLRDGELTHAKRVDRSIDESGDVLLHVLGFEFTDRRGRTRRLEQREHKPEQFLDDDAGEPLLYDDLSAALLDALPGRPRVREGIFVSSRPTRSLAITVATVVVVLATPVAAILSVALSLR